MRIGIFGTKQEAGYLAKCIKQSNIHKMMFFIDNDKNKQGTLIDEINVISAEQFKHSYRNETDAVVIAMRGSFSRLTTIYQLKELQAKRIGVFLFSYSDCNREINDFERAIVWLDTLDKPFMPYLEYNVTDSCNLKCKGCNHFSNLCEDNIFADSREFAKDLSYLAQKVSIGQLRLLGGEALLHKNLMKFIQKAREILPDTDIYIVTNGLLIPSLDNSFLKEMKRNNIIFDISRYVPTNIHYDVICEVLKKEEVGYHFTDEVIRQFGKTLNIKGNSDVKKSQAACVAKGCRLLKNGKLYKCSVEGVMNYFTEYFNCKMVENERGIDIYDTNIDWRVLLDKLYYEPVEMCKFCAEKCELFEWKAETLPQKEDWVVD